MAGDPNRDIFPVKDGSCADTCFCNIDPRERHLVCKLDRYTLEDKYLRLLEETNKLKKLSNSQEDKIKRLATKLLRVSANPRTCSVALDLDDDKKRITGLELENSKLKDKISVLRNQLLSHAITGRSSSRSRNPQGRPSSGRITCRTESSRAKGSPSCRCTVESENDDLRQNYIFKIEEMEAERRDALNRIAQLEKDLATCASTCQREKVADNVEYIRVWRQTKQLNDKLIAARSTNETLKRVIQETTKKNNEMTMVLVTEKKRISEMDEQLLKSKESKFSLREKNDEIKDLVSEIKILREHNNELVALSSKNGQIEQENAELKKKLSEHVHDQQALMTAFNTDQANILALQNANRQLLDKLQELQKNIDSLTTQLASFQVQSEKREASSTKEAAKSRRDRREDRSDRVENCEKCCETYEKILRQEFAEQRAREKSSLIHEFVQTECLVDCDKRETRNQGTAMSPDKEILQKAEPQIDEKSVEKTTMVENSLTPEMMLKLLEQAQISAPMETSRSVCKDAITTIDYAGVLDSNQRHRQVVSLEKLLFGDSNC